MLGCCRSNATRVFLFSCPCNATHVADVAIIWYCGWLCARNISNLDEANDAELSACLAIDAVGWVYTSVSNISLFFCLIRRALHIPVDSSFSAKIVCVCACAYTNFGNENIYSESRTEKHARKKPKNRRKQIKRIVLFNSF